MLDTANSPWRVPNSSSRNSWCFPCRSGLVHSPVGDLWSGGVAPSGMTERMTAPLPCPPVVPRGPIREAGMNTVQARDALVGAWRLVSWENRAADGQVTHPMGTDAIGYVLYTADGRFSITILCRGRARST